MHAFMNNFVLEKKIQLLLLINTRRTRCTRYSKYSLVFDSPKKKKRVFFNLQKKKIFKLQNNKIYTIFNFIFYQIQYIIYLSFSFFLLYRKKLHVTSCDSKVL